MNDKNLITSPEPLTREMAITQNKYFDANQNTSETDLLNFLQSHAPSDTVYVTTVNSKDLLLMPAIVSPDDYSSIQINSADTRDMIIETATWETLKNMVLVKSAPVQTISNGKVNVFLDAVNIRHYKDLATEYLKKPDELIGEDTKITGRKFAEKIDKCIDVANQIMSGSLLPDLFDRLPLKKNGTFPVNRTIPIYKTGITLDISSGFMYMTEVILCITTENTWDGKQTYDATHMTSPVSARMSIRTVSGAKKSKALIAANLSTNDQPVRVSYLDTVTPGCIYKEKSGSEYLYLGYNVLFASGESDYGLKYELSRQRKYLCYKYIRMSKKLSDLYEKSPDMITFLKAYVASVKSDSDINISERQTQRKFTELVNDKFAGYLDSLKGTPKISLSDTRLCCIQHT